MSYVTAAMKTIHPLFLFLIGAALAGCTDKKAVEEKARHEAEAKARAEAARKEMQTLPQVFRPRYDGKRLEPEPVKTNSTTAATDPDPAKKP